MYSVKSPACSGKKNRSGNADSVANAARYIEFLDFLHNLAFQTEHSVSEAGPIYVIRYKIWGVPIWFFN
jgi:hypothetical protein